MVFAEQPVGLCNAYAQSGTAPGNTAFPALDVCDPDFSDIDDAEQIASVTVAMEAKYLSKVSYLNSIQLLVGGTLMDRRRDHPPTFRRHQIHRCRTRSTRPV